MVRRTFEGLGCLKFGKVRVLASDFERGLDIDFRGKVRGKGKRARSEWQNLPWCSA